MVKLGGRTEQNKAFGIILAFLIVGAMFSIPPNFVDATSNFAVGDLVEVCDSAGLKVRDNPAGTYLTTEPYGSKGIIRGGPQSASLGGVTYTWWYIEWKDGVKGWSAEGYPGGVYYIQKVPPQAPTALSPGSSSEPGPTIYTLAPTLQWEASFGADYYALAISEYPYGSSNIVYNPQQIYGTSHPVPEGKLQSGKKYRWNLQAHSSGGWSSISNTLYFQTSDGSAAEIISYYPTSKITVYVSQEFTLSVTFKNTGTSGANFYAGVTVWDSSGNQVRNLWSDKIYVSTGSQGNASWTTSLDTAGEYWLQFGIWDETKSKLLDRKPSPSQNLIRVEPQQTGKPDLTVLGEVSFTPSSVVCGQSLSAQFTVKNVGSSSSGSFYVRVSLATTEYGTDYSLGNFQVSSLSAGESKPISLTTDPIPSSVPAGSYYVTAFVDAFQGISESNEYNNIGSSTPNKVEVPPPSPAPSHKYTLTVSVIPASGGNVSLNPAGGSYDPGTVVTLTASAVPGYRFVHWGGPATSSWSISQCQTNPVTITMDGNKEISANFDGIDITVTSPNGGEVWLADNTYTITWSVSGDTSNISYFKLAYSTNGGSTWQEVTPNAIPSSARFYDWKIPSGISSTQCRVKVRAIDAEGWILDYDISDGNFTIMPGQGTLQPPASVTAAIEQQLLDLIDQHTSSYYKSTWNLSLEQYKAWIATIAWAEGGRGGYTAHSQGALGSDVFDHKLAVSSFRFSTGIGPFQIDRIQYPAWGIDARTMPTIDKLDPEKALMVVLKYHYYKFGSGATLNDFAQESDWIAVRNPSPYWNAVTGTSWDSHKNGKANLEWNGVKSKLAQNASSPSYRYGNNVQFLGPVRWNIKESDGIKTDTGKKVVFDGFYQTWLITSRDWSGTELFKYYYTQRPDEKIEVWVWDHPELKYIFVREYSTGPLPENRHGSVAGETLTSPALAVSDLPPSCSIQLLDKTTDSQITQVDANKAFYIHVIASDDFGITQVRFSSDDSQEGNPTGSWTEWLSWDTSSSHWTGYWNAVTKKKEWTFTTAGSKEVWAEVKDTSGKTKSAKANIYCYSPTKEEWVSYVPTPEQTEIEISTEGGVASAKVILTFPNAGYRVTDWGTVRRDGNELSAEAKVERWTGASAQVITALNHTYNLGTLAPGAYKFTFKAWGQTVESKAFEIKPELKPSMNIQPTAWSDSVEAGKSKSQTFTVSASGGTVKNVILTKISGPDWLAVSSPSLGDIPAGSSKRFMIIASPPTGISGLFGYSVRITCAEGEPKSVDVSGTITVLWPASPTPTADVFQFPVGKLNQLGIRIATKEKGDDDGWSVEENFGDFDADIRGYHPGEDWNRDTEGDTDVGENVYAVANGIVYDIKESVKRGLGGGVVIRHALTDGTEVYSVYVHIEPSRDLRIGQAVNRGIPVGKIAKIDLPAHLHFEIRTKPTKPVEQGGWYPNDMGNGYYETTEKMREDGFLDPSQFILSHIGREIPELKQKLKERISLLLEGSVDTYPPHLQVPFAQSKYDELYKAGIDFNVLSVEALEKAERLLEEGDPGGAQKYLNRALRLRMASDGCFSAAAEVAEKRYKTIQDVIRPIYELDKIAAKAIAVGIPGAEPLINALYFSTDFAIDYSEAGWEEAVKNRAADIAVDVLLSEIKIDGRALEDLLKNRIGKVTFPVIQEAVEKNKQAIASKIAKQLGLELAVWASEKTGKELDRVSNQIAEEAARLVRSWLMSRLKSPGELRVYDSQGRVTGLVRGEVKNEIPRSVYDNEAVIIFYPTDSYCYEVAGTDNGVYGLEVTSAESGKVNAFAVSSVPTSAGCVHHYAIDWSALVASEGRGGVAVRIDSDGDGTFENVFSPLALEKTEIAPPVRIITPELAVLETPQDLSRPVSLGEKFEMHLRRVKPEVPLELRMENSKISRVLVDLKKARENVKVTIEKLQGRPSGLPNPPGLTWAYCRIEVSVPDDAVENAEIDFWVSKEWLSFHQIDKRDIRLLRFEGGWKELKTEVCEEDAACVIYRAMTPAFSVFAVTARAPLPSALGKVASASALAVILISVLAVLRRRRGKGVCFNCGKEPPAGARFCPFCGAKLEGSLREREPSRELPVPSRSKTRPNLRAPAGKARKARALGGRNTLRKQRKVLRPRGPLGPRTLGPRTVLRSKEKKSEGFIEDLSQLR